MNLINDYYYGKFEARYYKRKFHEIYLAFTNILVNSVSIFN